MPSGGSPWQSDIALFLWFRVYLCLALGLAVSKIINVGGMNEWMDNELMFKASFSCEPLSMPVSFPHVSRAVLQ